MVLILGEMKLSKKNRRTYEGLFRTTQEGERKVKQFWIWLLVGLILAGLGAYIGNEGLFGLGSLMAVFSSFVGMGYYV